ncbi:hypothetical protein Tco_0238556, partial [Tanacetum coccineum]
MPSTVGKLCGLKVSPSRSLVRICRGYNPLKPRQLPRGATWHDTWLSDPLTRLLTGGQPPLTGGPVVVRGLESEAIIGVRGLAIEGSRRPHVMLSLVDPAIKSWRT